MNNRLKLHIPKNNILERIYAVEVLFKELLGLNYSIIEEEYQTESLLVEVDEHIVVFEDHLFGINQEPKSYLKQVNIPQSINKLSSFSTFEVPIIFGIDKYELEGDRIVCGLDILASTFFMLTRWEEYVLGRKDTGKCKEDDLLCVKAGYERIPIVHVYEEFLKHIFHEVGFEVEKQRTFSLKTTHDVDRCYLTSWKEMFVNARKIYSKGNKQQAWKIVKDYIWYKTHFKNPFDTYDFFMNCAESVEIKDEFYFKCCEVGEKGYTYNISDVEVQHFIQHINQRGHKVGFHPSENTFLNSTQFFKEASRLSDNTKQEKITGRNHELLIVPQTFRDWESANAEFVSNYGYQARNGFRCGIAVPYPMFDIEQRRMMKIKEIPFEIMDTVMLRRKPTTEEAYDDIKGVVDVVLRYNGMLCTNWHSNVYNMRVMVKYKPVYNMMIEYVVKLMGRN